MCGYAGFSMSNNAVAAYRSGTKPLSRITASDLRKAGWTESLSFAKWLAEERHWRSCSWHHTSKHYQETEFYDPVDLIEWSNELEPEERESLKMEYNEARREENRTQGDECRVAGIYTQWTGSRRHPKRKQIAFTGLLRNGWIYLDAGGKKAADGNWIQWERVS